MTEPREEGWRLSKRISVETVGFLILQTIGLTILLTQMHSQIGVLVVTVETLGETIKIMPRFDTRITMLEDKQVTALAMIDRIAKMEQQVNDLGDLVKIQSVLINRIDNKLPNEVNP